jgi:hypothetical protein
MRSALVRLAFAGSFGEVGRLRKQLAKSAKLG